MKRLVNILLILFLHAGISYGQAGQDDFQDAVSEMGLSENDLGIQPKGYWSRYPQNVYYLSPAFSDLFADPVKIYDLTRLMASKIETFLGPETKANKKQLISNLSYSLGYSNQLTGFRGFPIALESNSAESMEDILHSFYASSERIGEKKGRLKASQLKELVNLPLWLHQPFKDLLLNLTRAVEYYEIAMRNVDEKKCRQLFEQWNYLDIQDGSSMNYHLYIDLMATIDEQSLAYSSMIAMSACETFCAEVDSLNDNDQEQHFEFRLSTPVGDIVVSGTDDQDYSDTENCFLIIDLGGNDVYNGQVAATAFHHPFSLVLDFDGDDHYTSTAKDACSQGAGILGTGILIDRKGTDTYTAVENAQGFGLFGTGILIDLEGNDKYTMENSGQGCGYFGLGLNLDVKGDDQFYIFGNGQGMAGVHGTGILCNYSGVDTYIAEADPSVCASRADYHSKGAVNSNFAQGAAQGRRGDLGDGHSMAGGFGFLFDLYGDDTYKAGNFSQGIGYWFGTGVLFDENGDDTYQSVYFTQASAAHFAMGALIDRSGNDSHMLNKTSGAGLAFGWDFCNSLYVDESGDDTYEVQQFSIANSMIRSNTYFIEYAGNDTYKTSAKDEFFGACDWKDYYKNPPKALFYSESKQVACFIDADGTDRYLSGNEADGWTKNELVGNNSSWSAPDSAAVYNNYFLGKDVEKGKINWIEQWNAASE